MNPPPSTPEAALNKAGGTAEVIPIKPDQPPPQGNQTGNKAEVTYKLIDPVSLELRRIPEREWIVPGWLPIGNVAAIYGDGGTGKTLIAQQLMTSCATGALWCGMEVRRCRSLALFCEDDENELHRRQNLINSALGVGFADLGDMRWVSGVGQDNALVHFLPEGKMYSTDRLAWIDQQAKEFHAELIVIDTIADVFPGNENDRHQVRQFIGALTKIAIDRKCAVLLPAHPSRSGIGTGNLDGGSTAWNNSVRSRWSLARPNTEGGERPAQDERILTRRKANYAGVGDTINLRWVDGALIPMVSSAGGVSGAVYRQSVDDLFLEMIDRCNEQGLHVSGSKTAANYAPKLFAGRPDSEGYTRADFDKAMTRLFTEKRIRLQQYGRPGDCRHEIVRVNNSQQAPE